MSDSSARHPLLESMQHLRRGSGWIIFFGAVSLLAGIVALGSVAR